MDYLIQLLIENNIEFEVSECPVDSEDGTVHNIGYNFENGNIFTSVIPNYNNNRVEFLILNQNLLQHLLDEGYTEKEIDENGKIWTHITSLATFKKLLKASVQTIKNN